jgi:hypothetical protein
MFLPRKPRATAKLAQERDDTTEKRNYYLRQSVPIFRQKGKKHIANGFRKDQDNRTRLWYHSTYPGHNR